MSCEEWRDVPGTNGHYSVSSLGQVRSNPRIIPWRNGRFRTYKDTLILRPKINQDGRAVYDLYGKLKLRSVMVASAFLGDKPVGLQVSHKNGNKLDDRVSNLEYLSASLNQLNTADALSRRNKTGIRGVSWRTDSGAVMWRGSFCINGNKREISSRSKDTVVQWRLNLEREYKTNRSIA